jgi:hypothetical protein
MVCQMWISEESRVHLRVMRNARSAAIRQALLPLLANLPAVTLAMAWDDSRGCWTSTIMPPPRFALGRLVATPGALRALADAGQDPMPFVARHHAGDWGEVPEEDARENAYALEHGFRLVSAYRTALGVSLWIITEAESTEEADDHEGEYLGYVDGDTEASRIAGPFASREEVFASDESSVDGTEERG